jgi:hypothetical protein
MNILNCREASGPAVLIWLRAEMVTAEEILAALTAEFTRLPDPAEWGPRWRRPGWLTARLGISGVMAEDLDLVIMAARRPCAVADVLNPRLVGMLTPAEYERLHPATLSVV